jgi:hypothetical protein
MQKSIGAMLRSCLSEKVLPHGTHSCLITPRQGHCAHGSTRQSQTMEIGAPF